MVRPNLSESSSKWPRGRYGKLWKKLRRIARKVEKRQWPKEERKADD